MRILFVTHYFAPNEGSSADQFTRMARLLQHWGHEVTVLTTMPHYPEGKIPADYRGKAWQVREMDGVRIIYSWLWATPSPRISRKLISQISFMPLAVLRGLAIPKPDVTFIEAQPIFTGLVGRMVSRLKGAPYVLNVSDLWPDHLLAVGAMPETALTYRTARALMDSGYRGAAAIIAMSPAWASKVVTYSGGQADKVKTIYRGVNTHEFQPNRDTTAFRANYGLSAGKLVTFIGTFATQYDFEAVFATAKHLQARTDVQVVIVGTGSQQAFIAAQVASGQYPNVRFIEWLPHTEMPLAWCASYMNIWAMHDEPLYYGTIPAKIYEAYATGTPIVAAQGGECASLILESGGGLTVAPGDTPAFIQAIERMLDNPDLRTECSNHARAYAELHFDFDRAVRQHEAVFLQAAKQD